MLTSLLPNRTASVQQFAAPIDPPPYEDSLSDIDCDCEQEEEDLAAGHSSHDSKPLSLTINSASSVHGSNNVLQTPPPPYSEITALSTAILGALSQLNNAAESSATTTTSTSQHKRLRSLKIDLTINCGITVIGDRNVAGGIGLRPRGSIIRVPGSESTTYSVATAAAVAVPGDAASGGAKRKAENVS